MALTAEERAQELRAIRRIRMLLVVFVMGMVLLLGLAEIFLPKRSAPSTPRQPVPYIIVYGRRGCSLTQNMLAALDAERLPYTFKSVDTPAARDEMWAWIHSWQPRTNRVTYPVMDVNGRLLIHPPFETVLERYGDF